MRALSALLVVLAATEVAALPSLVVHHQGRLLGGNDQPPAGPVDLKVELHSFFAAGPGDTILWQDTFQDVPLDAYGCYGILLGDNQDGHVPLTPEIFRSDVWLKVSVDGVAMDPWLQIGLSPSAAFAINAEKIGGLDLAALDARYVRASGGQAGAVSIAGDLTAVSFTGAGGGLTGLDASQLSAGTIPAARLPSALAWTDRDNTFDGTIGARGFTGSGAGLTALDASQLSSGLIPAARLPDTLAWTNRDTTFGGLVAATRFTGNGAGLTALDASQLTTGTLPAERIATNSLPLAALAKGTCAAGEVIRRKLDDSGWECFALPKAAGPVAFSFTNVTGAALNTLVESAPVTVSGFEGTLAAVCTGCEVKRGSGPFLTVLPGVTAGDQLTLRLRSSTLVATAVNSVVTVGATMSAPWSVTTLVAQIPDCFNKPVHTTPNSMNELLATMPTNTWICVKSGSSAAVAFKLVKSLSALTALDTDLETYFDTSIMRWTTDGGANWSTPIVRGYWFDESGGDDYMFLSAADVSGGLCRGGASCTGITWRYDPGACSSYIGTLNYSGTAYGCNGQSGSLYTANW